MSPAADDLLPPLSVIFALVRSRTGWARTDRAITGLIKFTMEAQILPTLCSILFLAGYYAVSGLESLYLEATPDFFILYFTRTP